jgi:protein phosphatase
MHIHSSSLPQSQMLFGDPRVRGHLFIVADGMGGHKGGEEASALAIVSIEDFLLRALHWFFRLQGDAVLNEFQIALRAADDRIFAEAQRQPRLRGMGTTVTLAYVVGQVLYVVHAGDSRLYLVRSGKIYQLTQDHTLVGELVRNKVIDPETASHHPMRNVITNSVGGDKPGVQPEVNKLQLAGGDTLLLCSDGLSEMLTDGEIAEVLQREDDPQRACDLLVVKANEKGGTDNITAVVARFVA